MSANSIPVVRIPLRFRSNRYDIIYPSISDDPKQAGGNERSGGKRRISALHEEATVMTIITGVALGLRALSRWMQGATVHRRRDAVRKCGLCSFSIGRHVINNRFARYFLGLTVTVNINNNCNMLNST